MIDVVERNTDIQTLEMVMEIVGNNYQGVLTEDNVLSLGIDALNEMVTSPFYSEAQRLNAFCGLQKLANNTDIYTNAAATLLGDALYSDNSEYQKELLCQLSGVKSCELADMVAQFLTHHEREVRIAALSILTCDRSNEYAQSLLGKCAPINTRDIQDYLVEIQVELE